MEKDILLFLVGIMVGGMNAIAGGGGLVGFPMLLAVGLPALVADATSYVAVLPGQISSAFGYRKYLRRVPKMYLLLLIPTGIGSAIGAQLLRRTSFTDFEKVVPFLIFMSVLLFALQPFLHFHLLQHIRSRHKSLLNFSILSLAILALATYGGYFGIALGFALLAVLRFTNVQEIHMLNGMKNIAAIIVTSVAIISIYSAHVISWKHGLVMGAGNLLGGYAGSRLAQRIPSHIIRAIVIVVGLVAATCLALFYH